MKKTMVVVTDLGSLKAYRLEHTNMNTPRLVLLEEFKNDEVHDKLLDKVSDQAGRWRVPTANMGMSYGERTKVDIEVRKRLVRQLAERLRKLLKTDGIEQCYFAASKEIAHPMLDELDGACRSKIVKTVSADLTKVDKSELLSHF